LIAFLLDIAGHCFLPPVQSFYPSGKGQATGKKLDSRESESIEYAQKGYVVDVFKEPVIAKVIASGKPAVTWNGKQWAVPMDFGGIGIIYKKEIFARYGLKAPTLLAPPLTTLHQPGFQKGKHAAALALALLHGRIKPSVRLSFELRVRGSTAPAQG
jgi:hypothetical protein